MASLCYDAEGATFDCDPGMICDYTPPADDEGECVDPVEWARRNP